MWLQDGAGRAQAVPPAHLSGRKHTAVPLLGPHPGLLLDCVHAGTLPWRMPEANWAPLLLCTG